VSPPGKAWFSGERFIPILGLVRQHFPFPSINERVGEVRYASPGKSKYIIMSSLRGCLLVLALLTVLLPLWGQSSDWSGQWVGQLTQQEGGYRSVYDFEVYLVKLAGNTYRGRTYVWTDGVYGEMSFTGQLYGEVLHLQEIEVVYSRKPADLSWCLKSLQLRLVRRQGQWYLEGPWQGASGYGPCIPGFVVVKRQAPQA
jgi:hypothetical protein